MLHETFKPYCDPRPHIIKRVSFYLILYSMNYDMKNSHLNLDLVLILF